LFLHALLLLLVLDNFDGRRDFAGFRFLAFFGFRVQALDVRVWRRDALVFGLSGLNKGLVKFVASRVYYPCPGFVPGLEAYLAFQGFHFFFVEDSTILVAELNTFFLGQHRELIGLDRNRDLRLLRYDLFRFFLLLLNRRRNFLGGCG
jgi:hypothetical protein